MSSPVLDRAMTEDELLQTVGEALTLYGWRWTHSRRSDRAITMGAAGLPDIIAVRRDRLAFIELKSEAGRLSPEQRAWLGALQTVAARQPAVRDRPNPETWLVRPSVLGIFLANIR